jgi:hypothetical protein
MTMKPVAQVVAVEPEGPDGHGVNWLTGAMPKPGELLYSAHDYERLERGAQSMSGVIDNHCIAMQAALIDAQERGLTHGLKWIWNTLAGPGLLPDFDAAKAMGGAQAWFDAKTAESEALKRNAV